jgi:hypothetical protein
LQLLPLRLLLLLPLLQNLAQSLVGLMVWQWTCAVQEPQQQQQLCWWVLWLLLGLL